MPPPSPAGEPLTAMSRHWFVALAVCLLSSGMCRAEEPFRVFTSVDGKPLEARLVKAEGDDVTLVKRSDNREVVIPLEKLSFADIAYIGLWQEKQGAAPPPKTPPTSAAAETAAKEALFPRPRDEVRSKIREIMNRDRPKELDKTVHEAVCRLNVYRFLSGVPDDVEADPQMIIEAKDAAEACAAAGRIAHDLGHSTNKCNLSQGASMVGSVDNYIGDGGDNNREARGHRRWCLNPAMKKTGFGSKSEFSAMWSLDGSGPKMNRPWSYPGRGYYPLEWLKGNSWSVYLTSPAPPAASLKVRLWKLHGHPATEPPVAAEPSGKAMEIHAVFNYDNAINFEPEGKAFSRGAYLIRIEGAGEPVQIVTELY